MTPPWIPISRMLATGRSADTVVARRLKGGYTWQDFERHVAGLCAQLERQPMGRWLLSCDSTYAFSVGLFALWHTGRTAVLPPNQQPDSLRESAQGVSGCITDGNSLKFKGPKKETRWKKLTAEKTFLELFTSGSTGKRQAIKKTLAQLERELAVLEKTFGKTLGACDIYATVSHQHIYGLLFRLLWPLSAGRPFAENAFLFWEELLPRIHAGKRVSLVSSPAHLQRLSADGESALRKNSARLIFSSGGPLSDAAAERIRATTGKYPVEVLGSTETGGVAWRSGDALWQPLEGVELRVDSAKENRLKVKSPFGSHQRWMLMGDRAQLAPDGRFTLLGRADRIVKLAEKRLSLDDMEARLAQHPLVAAARLILIDDSHRATLGAVIVLHPKGQAQLARTSRATVTTDLRHHLQKSFDASSVPRAFRFVTAFPMDALGKVTQAALSPLFDSPVSPSVTTPCVLKKTHDHSRLSQRLRVPEELLYLEGHFPNYPIVPGVVQIKWVVEAATLWLGRKPIVRKMEAVKFKTPLFPGQEFTLEIEREIFDDEALLRFSLMNGETLYSSGRLILA